MNEAIHWFKIVVTQHYADFQGRAGRAEFWYFVLAYFILIVVLSILETFSGIVSILTLLILLGLFVPSLALDVRRLHDIDKSGWWLLLGLIPILGAIVLIYWFVQPSTPGANRFGPSPQGAAPAASA